VNYKPFPFHFNPNVFASTDPVLLLGMVVFIFAMPWLYRRKRGILAPFMVFWSTISLFALQYVLGGKTQFSFYATVLVPPAAIVMGVTLNELLKWEAFRDSLRFYWKKLGELMVLISERFNQKQEVNP
jgi:predicted membrane-bound dolichyl-phosphate-mannose-protein mannosyltransferase